MLVGIIVPVVFFLVTGLILVTYIYFRSKEKQMMIERGMSYEQMLEYLKSRKNPYTFLKIGIITVFFGIGLGLGIGFQDSYYGEAWTPFFLFTLTGLGFVAAFFIAKKMEDKDNGK